MPKKNYKILNYTEHLLKLASTVSGCISISAFSSSVDISVGIASSEATLKICVITVGIKKYKPVINKKKKKLDKVGITLSI